MMIILNQPQSHWDIMLYLWSMVTNCGFLYDSNNSSRADAYDLRRKTKYNKISGKKTYIYF
jgi:hypothetical protein